MFIKKITFLLAKWIELARSVKLTDYRPRPTLKKEMKSSISTVGVVPERRPMGLIRPATHINADRKDMRLVCLFIFGATAPSGPGPPHSRGF